MAVKKDVITKVKQEMLKIGTKVKMIGLSVKLMFDGAKVEKLNKKLFKLMLESSDVKSLLELEKELIEKRIAWQKVEQEYLQLSNLIKSKKKA